MSFNYATHLRAELAGIKAQHDDLGRSGYKCTSVPFEPWRDDEAELCAYAVSRLFLAAVPRTPVDGNSPFGTRQPLSAGQAKSALEEALRRRGEPMDIPLGVFTAAAMATGHGGFPYEIDSHTRRSPDGSTCVDGNELVQAQRQPGYWFLSFPLDLEPSKG